MGPAVQEHVCAHGERVLQVIHTAGKALPLLGNSGLR